MQTTYIETLSCWITIAHTNATFCTSLSRKMNFWRIFELHTIPKISEDFLAVCAIFSNKIQIRRGDPSKNWNFFCVFFMSILSQIHQGFRIYHSYSMIFKTATIISKKPGENDLGHQPVHGRVKGFWNHYYFNTCLILFSIFIFIFTTSLLCVDVYNENAEHE